MQGGECLQWAQAGSMLLQLGLQPGRLMLGCQHLSSCMCPLRLLPLHALPSYESLVWLFGARLHDAPPSAACSHGCSDLSEIDMQVRYTQVSDLAGIPQ